MRVAFVDLSWYHHMSYGLLSLADAVHFHGHTVKIFGREDGLALLWREGDKEEQRAFLGDAIRCFKPDVVGLSAFSVHRDVHARVTEDLKKWVPEATLVLGGQHVYVADKETLGEAPAAEFAFFGEAEDTFPSFLQALESDRVGAAEIPGLIFREGGKIKMNSLPSAPDFSEYNPLRAFLELTSREVFGSVPNIKAGVVADVYFVPAAANNIPFLLSRGCPYRCSFCRTLTNPFLNMRYLDPTVFERLLDYAISVGSARSILIHDSQFDLNKRWAREIVEVIRSRSEIEEWCCQLRPNLLTEEFLDFLIDAGCRVVSMYPENAVERIRNDVLNKGVSDEELDRAYTMISNRRVYRRANVIMSCPTETIDDLRENIEFIERWRPEHVNVFPLFKIPGTALAEKYGGMEDLYFHPYPESLKLQMELRAHYSFFGQILRDVVKFSRSRVLILQHFAEQGRPMTIGQYSLPTSTVEMLLFMITHELKSEARAPAQVEIAVSSDAQCVAEILPSGCIVTRFTDMPIGHGEPHESTWAEIKSRKPDIILSTISDETQGASEDLVRIGVQLNSKLLVLLEPDRGMVLVYDLVTRLFSSHCAAPDIKPAVRDAIKRPIPRRHDALPHALLRTFDSN